MSSISDVYGRNLEFGGSFSADGALLTFPGALGGENLLVIQAEWSYPQQVQILHSLSSAKGYIFAAPNSEGGTLRIGRIVGPQASISSFFTTFGNVCSLNNSFSITASAGCEANTDQKWADYTATFHNVVITNIGGSMSVQDFMIKENIELKFFKFTFEAPTPPSTS